MWYFCNIFKTTENLIMFKFAVAPGLKHFIFLNLRNKIIDAVVQTDENQCLLISDDQARIQKNNNNNKNKIM